MDDHRLTIDNRSLVSITDVLEIDGFDEEEVKMTLKEEGLIIKGSALNIKKLDLEEGFAEISGRIDSIAYVKSKGKKGKKLMARIFKRCR